MNHERYVSYDPSDARPPALSELLQQGELDSDFKQDSKGDRLETPRRVVDSVVEGANSLRR